jgi:hypothetical protein
MLKGAEERGDLEGVRVCREAPVISHLLFADDSHPNARRQEECKLSG